MRLKSIAIVAAALGLLVAPWASAQVLPFSCLSMNAENIANGTADPATGYTTGISNFPSSGIWTFFNDAVVDLPENGVICAKRFDGDTGQFESLTFNRNVANTPVYLLVEDSITLNRVGIDVSGKSSTSGSIFGATAIGGIGGPGGSDGGSCENLDIYGAARRIGDGQGPGGGTAWVTTTSGGGGGGASPVTNASNGFSGGVGGQAFANVDDYIVHGGGGGACGGNAAAGAGGGGVIVIATNGTFSVGNSGSAGVFARGGYNSASYGGGGGGGIIRIIANRIEGTSGNLDVRQNGGNVTTCSTSSHRGGCGGNGLLRLETPIVDGVVAPNVHGVALNNPVNLNGEAAVRYSLPRAIFQPTSLRPLVEILEVEAIIDGQSFVQPTGVTDPTGNAISKASVVTREGGVVNVTVQTTHVPVDADVFVRMNGLQANTEGGDDNATVLATSPTGAGPTKTWSATLTVPPNSRLGTIEAWVESVCTPGASGCPAVP